MRPTDHFERDLERALCGAASTPEQLELARISACLRQLAADHSRSEPHQQWAWTRLQAHTPPASSGSNLFSPHWFATGAALALCLGLALFLLRSEPSHAPTATIVSKGDQLHAVPFHSERANADVIWVDGYDYLPASYPLR